MNRKITFVFALILACQACQERAIPATKAACENTTSFAINATHPKADLLQSKLDEYVALGLPGASILYADSSGIWMGTSGMADLENNIKMESCHINKLGSVTKMMVGSLLWLMIQDGLLAIDDPISMHIPEVAERIPNGSEITVKMLVNHSSGIADIARDVGFNLAVVNDFARSWTSEEIIEFIEDNEPTNLPGQAVHYSNTNTMLTSLILEAVGGRPHADLLQERIFDPLGMTETIYFDFSGSFSSEHLAQGYLDFNNDGGSIQNITDLNPGNGNGYTGVYSTVADMYVFMKALMVDQSIITPENLDQLQASLLLAESGSFYSSSFGIHSEYINSLEEGVEAFGHSGGDIGYSANLNYFPNSGAIYAGSYNYGTNLPTALGDQVNNMRKELLSIAAQ